MNKCPSYHQDQAQWTDGENRRELHKKNWIKTNVRPDDYGEFQLREN